MRAPDIARRQAGAFSRRQARAAGRSRDTIIRRLASGDWLPLVPDVFVAAGTPVTAWTRAWAGHLATGGVVCGPTAGALHGVWPDTKTVHVISRRNVHVRVPGIHEHRTRLSADDVERHGRLPITSRLRTVLDLLASEPQPSAHGLLFRAIQQQWLTPEEFEQQLVRRTGMTGTVQLRELAKLLGTGAHSVAEFELHRILSSMDGVRWAANEPLTIAGRRYVVDVLLPDHGIVIEVDGRRFHSSADQFTDDRRRQNDLTGHGFLVLRFTWLDVIEQPDIVRRKVRDTIVVSRVARTRRTGP